MPPARRRPDPDSRPGLPQFHISRRWHRWHRTSLHRSEVNKSVEIFFSANGDKYGLGVSPKRSRMEVTAAVKSAPVRSFC